MPEIVYGNSSRGDAAITIISISITTISNYYYYYTCSRVIYKPYDGALDAQMSW